MCFFASTAEYHVPLRLNRQPDVSRRSNKDVISARTAGLDSPAVAVIVVLTANTIKNIRRWNNTTGLRIHGVSPIGAE